jgi:Arc/MetJ-type ribon-helix-helix transcriptional regulator
MKPTRIEYPRRLSVQITDAMDARLEQVARGRDEAKSEVVRAALRAFLDEQEDVIGSRKHFTKAFGRRVDQVERLLAVGLWLNLQTLHLLVERVRKEPIDAGELLADAITEGVDFQKTVSELIESVVTHKKAKPPA